MILIPRNPEHAGWPRPASGTRLWIVAAVVALLAASGCVRSSKDASDTAGSSGSKLTVVAGFYPLFEAASRIGGDQLRVIDLTPAGAEPHDLELTPDQMQQTLTAKLVLYIGGGFQPALEEAVKQRPQGASVDVIEGMTLAEPPKVEGTSDAGEEDESLSFDPHVWLDPVLMNGIVGRVEKALADVVDPAHAATYRANAERYRDELGTLDADFRNGLASCPRKTIVTSHAAFGYLARRYGLQQLPISGVSPEAEPSPKRLQELAALARSTGVTTIFSETLVSPRTADALAREAGVTTAVLNPIEGLTPKELKEGKGYVSVMRDNLATLRTALGCGT